MKKELVLTTPGDREIRIVREFNARRTRVFDYYFKPELVRQWMMGPEGWTFDVCEIDLRVGGTYRYVLKGPEGAELAWGGVYHEVTVPERVVSAEKYDMDWTGGETLGTVEFAERDKTTTVTTSLVYSSKEARDGALKSGMAEGMGAGFDRIEALLAAKMAGGAPSVLKSVGAVVAGFATVVVLSTATDALLEALGVLPATNSGLYDNGLLALALAYRTVFTVLGGWVTAQLAPQKPRLHVLILAGLGVLGGLGGVAAATTMPLSPMWYPVALAVLAFPSVWWGGRLSGRR